MATRSRTRGSGPDTAVGPTMVRWGPVLASAVIGMGLFVILSSLWVALARDDEAGTVAENIEWFAVGSALAALAIAGFLAGWLSGVRGAGPGMMNGLTVWGLLATAAVAVGTPTAAATFDPDLGIDNIEPGAPTWAAFWALLIGLGAALLFGAIGGKTPRPVTEGMDDDGEIDLRERRAYAERDERYDRRDERLDRRDERVEARVGDRDRGYDEPPRGGAAGGPTGSAPR